MAGPWQDVPEKSYVPNSACEPFVIKESGRGVDTVSESDSEEAHFERESEQIIIKQVGSGFYAFVYATIADFDAKVLLIDWEDAQGDSDKRKAVIDKMRASLLAAKVLKKDRADYRDVIEGIQTEARMLKYIRDNYLDRGGAPTAVKIVYPGFGPKTRKWYSMELLSGGTAESLLGQFWNEDGPLGSTIPAGLLWHMLAQIGEALLFLHFGIVNGERVAESPLRHGDLHCGNIMFAARQGYGNYPDTLIADFGMSKTEAEFISDGRSVADLHKHQICDLIGLVPFLWSLADKADNDKIRLTKILGSIEDVKVTEGNRELRIFLQGLVKLAKYNRQARYEDLPDKWVEYFSRPAVSDTELEAFLEQFKGRQARDAAGKPE